MSGAESVCQQYFSFKIDQGFKERLPLWAEQSFQKLKFLNICKIRSKFRSGDEK
jgi:hypothetical protein